MNKRPRVEPIQPALFELGNPNNVIAPTTAQEITRPFEILGTQILLGTSSFTATGWQGSFYPQNMRSRDFLPHYASKFQTVEIDSSFYGTPSASTVTSWNEKTPSDFIFAVKVPQVVTREKALVDCDSEFEEFVKTMDILGPKLGPIMFQFPLFDRWKFPEAR
jgi:uncharacterized protein YecE (DUF72 family)